VRVRFAVLCGVLLFSVVSPATAHASGWSAFVAWLSSLDPQSGGGGIEVRFFCPKAVGPARFDCDRATNHPVIFKASAAILFGERLAGGDRITVFPALGSVETDINDHFSIGGGAGVIHVGGTLVDSVTKPLIQGQLTVKVMFSKLRLGIRPEVNVIPQGFPPGAFAVGAPATGTEVVPGVSAVFTF
jgi:hypothetical protein